MIGSTSATRPPRKPSDRLPVVSPSSERSRHAGGRESIWTPRGCVPPVWAEALACGADVGDPGVEATPTPRGSVRGVPCRRLSRLDGPVVNIDRGEPGPTKGAPQPGRTRRPGQRDGGARQ